ncbi:mitochondrial genome maintenance exonuclease 1 [Lepus europaeus]|uniref:mitochondrial genome maintenance exonuclease 1 n=1 Tax=Lepus europaeus TaxID=9983 RepID=UPI002B46E30D|nr:mitochondrial genome maintenance exonuclease 1 [Lepus europaeus]XP_062059807.1 mitochondrial genome maintenance exonuclease 1 [Lepus europaeus]XP_062059808.1 mitochondrial genome maintenance exonuclease 1 [Lepus europaeus]XP_062059809.1 mitochondrial genome maintenance exonuclease 1 [Lepus europaeus]XP_062059810.1 mitochondrial genome maintenance exonuclease 1 [Lepus europaeus]XP_062059811.1 mitochondrial genome maintenance exonuclease 1 [Lepus europaeus]XP_062059812.1 mitochondrial genome
MKAFQAVCRQLRPSKGFPGEPAPRVNFFTSSYCFGRKKKVNPYEEVDQEKYSDLVRSVLSCRGSAQTPESLFEEDALLYGPVSKRQPPKQDEEARVPRNWFPIFNPERGVRPDASDPSAPLKIPLQKKVIPSVTRILQHTMTPQQVFYLERWKQRMILELGEDGFAEYTSNIFLQGRRFHEALESILLPQGNSQGRGEDLLESGYIESVQHVLKDVSGVRALESAVQHETLKYAGLLDCVAEYQGKLCVIDWKTSEKPKPFLRNTFDNPLQVVAYVGAINYDANYSFQVQCGLIVVAYKDGSPAHPHFMDAELCAQYWAKWLLRLEEYTEKKSQNVQKPG